MSNKPNKIASVLKTILTRTCCVFCPVILLLYTAGAIVSNEEQSFIPTYSTVLVVFLISLIVSLSLLLYKSKKLSFPAAHLINFLIIGIFYYFTVVVMRNNAGSGSYTLVAMLVYVILFVLITFCVLATRSTSRKKINNVKRYDSKFE